MNQSKVADARHWLLWKNAGAVSELVRGVLQRVPSKAVERDFIAATRRSADAQYRARMTDQGAF